MWKRTRVCVLQLAVIAACGRGASGAGPAAPVTTDAAIGTYVATTFTSTTGQQVTDQLQGGGRVQVTLASDGTWRADYHVPPQAPATMTGAWSVSGAQVRLADLDQAGLPTTYTVVRDTLQGSHGFGATVVQLTLKRR